jgi:hypothetical protein
MHFHPPRAAAGFPRAAAGAERREGGAPGRKQYGYATPARWEEGGGRWGDKRG